MMGGARVPEWPLCPQKVEPPNFCLWSASEILIVVEARQRLAAKLVVDLSRKRLEDCSVANGITLNFYFWSKLLAAQLYQKPHFLPHKLIPKWYNDP
jgi:hypothetical protein